MDNPLISYCVPAFNVRNELPFCIESILTEGLEDIEVILVDDASSDDTHDLARQLAQGDSRVRLFRHPYNMGLPSARNTALEHATGEFIRHIDADDLVTSGSSRHLLDIIKDADIARGSSSTFHTQGMASYPMDWANHGIADFSVTDVSRSEFFRSNALGYVWLYLYRHSFLKDIGMPIFHEGLSILEDDIYNAEVLFKAERIAVTGTEIAMYRSGGMSSGKSWSFRQYLEQATALATVRNRLATYPDFLCHYLNRKANFVIERIRSFEVTGMTFEQFCAYAEIIRQVYLDQDLEYYRNESEGIASGYRTYRKEDVQFLSRIQSGEIDLLYNEIMS